MKKGAEGENHPGVVCKEIMYLHPVEGGGYNIINKNTGVLHPGALELFACLELFSELLLVFGKLLRDVDLWDDIHGPFGFEYS